MAEQLMRGGSGRAPGFFSYKFKREEEEEEDQEEARGARTSIPTADFIARMSVTKTVSSARQAPPPPRRTTPREAGSGTNVDERLKAARERREEQQRLLASRVHNRFERERRAKLHYEQQLQERQKKLHEHRLKEDQRRAAVEEKRRRHLKEEKERNEWAVRRSQEKAQRVQQKCGQKPSARKQPPKNVPRHVALSPWEKNLVSRLLTPTNSVLARSKNGAGHPSGEEVVSICRRAVSFYSSASSGAPTGKAQLARDPRVDVRKPQMKNAPVPRALTLPTRKTPSPPPPLQRGVEKQRSEVARPQKAQSHRAPVQRVEKQKGQVQQRQMKRSQERRAPTQRAQAPHLSPSVSQSRSANNVKPNAKTPYNGNWKSPNVGPDERSSQKNKVSTKMSRTSSTPSPQRVERRSSRRHSIPLQLELESVPEEDVVPICSPSPGNSRPVFRDKMEDSPEAPPSEIEIESRTAGDGSPSTTLWPPAEGPPPPSGGTTDPEEASRSLAERRREARLLGEAEERKSSEAAEAQRRCHEALEGHGAEERARQQARAQFLIAEKQRREQEEIKKAEEERARALREAALLLKQREEEQAREREKAARLQQERELSAQKEEAERQVRKKRLEEIMRRTRRTVSPDTKSATVSILANENTEPPVRDGAKPPGSRPSPTLTDDKGSHDDMLPVVAFKERRSLRTLGGLEDIQTHQRAVI
ncbi:uncharacterized protein LOC144206413 isoform X2 [Stigmatopora nigra]